MGRCCGRPVFSKLAAVEKPLHHFEELLGVYFSLVVILVKRRMREHHLEHQGQRQSELLPRQFKEATNIGDSMHRA